MGYNCFAIDFPGCGKSIGKSLNMKCEKILETKGPADVVMFVMKELDIKNPVLSGYDWGGAIAMKMALQQPSNFSKILAFHPRYTETKRDELKGLKLPTLIQWVK